MSNSAESVTQRSDYAGEAVPADQRTDKKSLTLSWWGCCSSIFWIILAATMAGVHGTVNTVIGIVLTCLTYSALSAIISRYAIQSGMSVSTFSVTLFGTRGAAIATFIFSMSALWYAVFESSVIAVAASYAFPSLSHTSACLIVIVLSVPLVFGRVQGWLNKLNTYLLPLYVLGLAYAVYQVVAAHGYSNEWLSSAPAHGPAPMGWWNVYVTYMGVWTLIMFCMDYARFGKREDARYHALLNFGMPFYVVTMLIAGICGIFIVETMGWHGATSETAAVKALIALMGIPGLLFIWATQTRINSANFYLATINLEALWATVTGKRLTTVVAGGIIIASAYALMLADVFETMLMALAYQSIFVVAWVSIAVTHILGFSHPLEESHEGIQAPKRTLEHPGLWAWFAAVGTGTALMQTSLSSFSAPATAIIACLVYWAVKRQQAAPRSPTHGMSSLSSTHPFKNEQEDLT